MTSTGVATSTDDSVETQGSDVNAAIAEALAQLGIERDKASVEVLSTGTQAAPGELLSATSARVRVTRIDAHTANGKALLEELLAKMNIPATVTVRRADGSQRADAPQPPMILDVNGEDLGLLIGWRGETLRAVQTVLNLMLGEDAAPESANRRLIVDVERYRARREDQVRELATRLAQRVRRSGERYTLDPMHAYERRIVHIALEGDESVRTESTGKEPARRIIIHPTGPAQGGDADDAPRRSFRDRR